MNRSERAGAFDPRYYTLDRLGEVGLACVRLSLKRFLKDYGVPEYPLDCFRLVRTVQEAGLIRLEVVEEGRLSPAFDASAAYFPEVDGWQIVIRPVPKDWRSRSSWRRCNFSLAHELGHIFCGHLGVPKNMKSEETRRQEDLEADEFAAELLMPERLILQCRFSSYHELSAAFLVSDQACFTRLNNLKRLDLAGAPRRAVCSVCGNARISPAAAFCEICGTPLDEKTKSGVRITEYARDLTAEDGRVLFCPVCGNEEYAAFTRFCRVCGFPAYNFCSGGYSVPLCRHANAAGARYCELCGSRTEFSLRGLLKDWRQEKEEYVRAAVRR